MTALEQPALTDYPIARIRQDFPILETAVRGKPLDYLDNAATSQKPQVVIDRLREYYEVGNANIHRGVHYLSEKATDDYDRARARVASFIGAHEPREVIFTRNATESFNLIAKTFRRDFLQPGDEILLTEMEHHANIVPWQMVAEETGAKIRVIPITEERKLDLAAAEKLISGRTAILGVVQISNALGVENPIEELIALAHAHDVPVVVDGSQAVHHRKVDVAALNADFYVFTGHKVYGPTGIGVLYGKRAWLERLPPFLGGGDMIERVSFDGTTYAGLPEKFEAGTPNIAGAIVLATALDYIESVGIEPIAAYEETLRAYGAERLQAIEGLNLLGGAEPGGPILSFTMEGAHPHDIATFLDADGIAVRAGHHCAQPLMRKLGLSGTARASFALYNTREEVDQLAASLEKIRRFFA